MADEAQGLRDKLTALMKKVPDQICNGSYQRAVGFKEWYVKANKAISRKEANVTKLNSFINQYEGFSK
jgi:hypothetical protein